MTEEKVRAIFLLADIKIEELTKTTNQYWPTHPSYDTIRNENPWWNVKMEHGTITIGWRKRVISINWEKTAYRPKADYKWEYEPSRQPLTRDEVTNDDTLIHAWGYGKAIEYLQVLDLRLAQCAYAATPEGEERWRKAKMEYYAKVEAERKV